MRLIIAAAALLATTAQAQVPISMPHNMMLDALRDRFGEEQRMIAASSRAITEIFENAETGSWTLLITGTNGMACIRGSGKGGVMINAQLEPDEGT